MEDIISRLKGMRILSKQLNCKRLDRKLSQQEIRKEKRYELFNYRRRLVSDWFHLDVSIADDYQYYSPNLCDDSKSLQVFFDYISGSIELSDNSAKNHFQSIKRLFNDDPMTAKLLNRMEFFERLVSFVSNTRHSNSIRFGILDLIETIVSLDEDILDIKDLVISSGLIFAVMVTLDTFDIELIIKIVTVMQKITSISNEILTIALNGGYLRFILDLITVTLNLNSRKTRTKQCRRVNDMKITLIQRISYSLIIMANDLNNTKEVIPLLDVFNKLIYFKDNQIICNSLMALNVIIGRHPKVFKMLNNKFMLSLTDLINKNNESITSSVIFFWQTFCLQFDTNTDKILFNHMMESNMIANIVKILRESNNNRFIKEVTNLMVLIIENNLFGVQVMMQIDVIPGIILSLNRVHTLIQPLLLHFINQIIIRIDSTHMLTYLLNCQLIDCLLSLNDENIVNYSSESYKLLLTIGQQFGRSDEMLEIAANYAIKMKFKSISV